MYSSCLSSSTRAYTSFCLHGMSLPVWKKRRSTEATMHATTFATAYYRCKESEAVLTYSLGQ